MSAKRGWERMVAGWGGVGLFGGVVWTEEVCLVCVCVGGVVCLWVGFCVGLVWVGVGMGTGVEEDWGGYGGRAKGRFY